MHFVVKHQFHALEVARAQQQILAERLAVLHNQCRTGHIKLVERGAIGLRLGSFNSSVSTTVSLPSASFEASAERNAPSSFLRGKA